MIVIAIIFGALAVSCYILAVLQFCGRGFLLNNSYIYASPEEREKMDKKPYYRQSGVVFCFIGTIFAINAVEVMLQTGWLSWVVFGVVAGAIIYAIVSSVLIGRKQK